MEDRFVSRNLPAGTFGISSSDPRRSRFRFPLAPRCASLFAPATPVHPEQSWRRGRVNGFNSFLLGACKSSVGRAGFHWPSRFHGQSPERWRKASSNEMANKRWLNMTFVLCRSVRDKRKWSRKIRSRLLQASEINLLFWVWLRMQKTSRKENSFARLTYELKRIDCFSRIKMNPFDIAFSTIINYFMRGKFHKANAPISARWILNKESQ